MKKAKEIILLWVLFIIFYALGIVICLLTIRTTSRGLTFVDVVGYFRLSLNGKLFLWAFINIFRKPFISSVVLISLSTAILNKKLAFTRLSFYVTAFSISFILSIVYLIKNAELTNALGYIFFSMAISFLCLIAFWIMELTAAIVKNLLRKKVVK